MNYKKLYKHFPLITFRKGREHLSVKSANTFTEHNWGEVMRKHIDDLAEIHNKAKTKDGVNASSLGHSRKSPIIRLDLRVPPGGKTNTDFLIQYGRCRGVLVEINAFK